MTKDTLKVFNNPFRQGAMGVGTAAWTKMTMHPIKMTMGDENGRFKRVKMTKMPMFWG